jgi:hypothetical protein
VNDEAARQGRPDNCSNRSHYKEYRRLRDEIERLRSGVWRAIEAFDDGDPRGACDLLLVLIEDDLRFVA